MEPHTSKADDIRWLLIKADELILTARKITPRQNPLRDDLDAITKSIDRAQTTNDNQHLDLGARQ